MQNKRKHTRYDLIQIRGQMTSASHVEVTDIGIGGIGLKADRKLDVGREYTIKLGDKGQSIDFRMTVVRSTLVGIEAGDDGESVLIYAVDGKFVEGSDEKMAAFLDSVEHHTKEVEALIIEPLGKVRFQITDPQSKVLVFPENFKVKDISLHSMLIRTDQPISRYSTIAMDLYLNDTNSLVFIGKIFSSQAVAEEDRICYEQEVTYSDLSEKDRVLLKKFIDYLVSEN